MNFFDYAEKLETIKYLCLHKRTGTPQQLANKLHVSERTIQRMIQKLREHGHVITFNRFRTTYEIEEHKSP